MARKAPHPTDKYVGSRVRMRRVTLGMSQEKLGDALGLTFQQVQKYEKGTNRIGASRVQQIANILEVPVEFLFAGGPDQPRQQPDGLHEPPSPAYLPDILFSPQGMALGRAFERVSKPKLRRQIADLVQQIVDCYEPE